MNARDVELADLLDLREEHGAVRLLLAGIAELRPCIVDLDGDVRSVAHEHAWDRLTRDAIRVQLRALEAPYGSDADRLATSASFAWSRTDIGQLLLAGEHVKVLSAAERVTLTDDELHELTGRRQSQAQRRALNAMGIDHRTRPDGSIVVLRTTVEAAKPKSARRKADPEPDFDALRRH